MHEIHLYEALKLIHDKENNLLLVTSTETDKRKAGNETYKAKDKLKAAGFEWTGEPNGRWAISDSRFEDAKKALSAINKTEYLISKLEDLDKHIGGGYGVDAVKGYIRSYIDELKSLTDEAAQEEEIRNYLQFFSKFRHYSFHNCLLIWIQKPDATRVAGAGLWKKKHRKVTNRDNAIYILAPKGQRSFKVINDEGEEEVRKIPSGFISVKVFDISDTEAINSKGEVPPEPQWWGDNDPSETVDTLIDVTSKILKKEGIKLSIADAKGGEKGYSSGGHINITSDVEGAGRFATLIHEFAHELLHHKKKSKFYEKYGAVSRSVAELQAESVSFVVLRHFDIPCKHSAKYLALWKAESGTIEANVQAIIDTANYIIGKINVEMGLPAGHGHLQD